jgi:hypothetical protein
MINHVCHSNASECTHNHHIKYMHSVMWQKSCKILDQDYFEYLGMRISTNMTKAKG